MDTSLKQLKVITNNREGCLSTIVLRTFNHFESAADVISTKERLCFMRTGVLAR